MKKYCLKKVIQMVTMLFLISIFAFAIIYAAPGDISNSYITMDMTAEQIEDLREHLGVNKSLPEQYLNWFSHVIRGDFGVSLANKSAVLPQLINRLPATVLLMGTSLFLAVLLSIPLGLWSGYKKNTFIDYVISGFTYVGMSMPTFWMGIMLIIFFSLKLHIFPSSGMHTIGNKSFADTIWHMVLPCLTLCLPTMATYVRYMKANVVREMGEEYVLTAKAKGISGKKLLKKHILKNTLLPIITLLGMNLSWVVCGTFIVESIFGWPGVGTLAMSAIKSSDYPILMAYIMLAGLLVVIGNFIADILYGVADPRIKREIDKVNGK